MKRDAKELDLKACLDLLPGKVQIGKQSSGICCCISKLQPVPIETPTSQIMLQNVLKQSVDVVELKTVRKIKTFAECLKHLKTKRTEMIKYAITCGASLPQGLMPISASFQSISQCGYLLLQGQQEYRGHLEIKEVVP